MPPLNPSVIFEDHKSFSTLVIDRFSETLRPTPKPVDEFAERCRASFAVFAREFWECVPRAGKLVWNWHMDVLCNELQIAAERVFNGIPRPYDLIFNVPFGTSKSSICSILFQPWTWTRMPTARHLTGTHTGSLAFDLASQSRKVIMSDKYQRHFPEIKLLKDTEGYYANTLGGERRTCTVGGKTPLGFHAHFLGIDDPIDPQGARSEADLENAKRFMTEVIPSRVVDKDVSFIYLVMQRLGYRDPTQVMLDTAKLEGAVPVRQICLPGELTSDVNPPEYAANYIDGLLDPNRLSRAVLQAYKARLGTWGYASQILQRPTPPGGGMFKVEYFNNRCRAAPYTARRVFAVDRAATQDGGCYTAGVLMAYDGQHYYVEDVIHGQWEPHERNQRILAACLKYRTRYGPDVTREPLVIVEDEGGSTSKDANRELARVLRGFRVEFEHPTGSKDFRAEPWSNQCACGNVYLVADGSWDIEGYIQEHVLFKPDLTVKRLGKLKDRVDASTSAFVVLNRAKTIGPMRVIRFGQKEQAGLKIIVCNNEQLATNVIEGDGLLIQVTDPPAPETPTPHVIGKVLGWLPLPCVDLEPVAIQADWPHDTPLPPWNRPVKELLLSEDAGKKLWQLLLRKNQPAPAFIVFADQDFSCKLAMSVAMAVTDSLGLSREKTIQRLGEDWICKPTDKPGNAHVYDVVRAARGRVI